MSAAPPAHLLALTNRWFLWREACLRGAGFPARTVADLAAPAAGVAVDRLVACEDSLAEARDDAIRALEQLQRSRARNRTIKALRDQRMPAATGSPEIGAALAPFVRAESRRNEAEREAREAMTREQRRVAAVLADVARDDRFREALLWQNRMAVHGSVASLLRRPHDATDSKCREQRRLIARYLQRYSVKNDTIGFFGPVGWARLEPDRATTVRAGQELLETRRVYFEHWAIDALAQRLAEDPRLRVGAVPRRTPGIWVEGTRLQRPDGGEVELPGEFAYLLAALDGQRNARELASAACAEYPAELSEADVFEMLDELASKRLCSWTFEIPTGTQQPELHLRELLERVGEVGKGAVATLERLDARRLEVAAASDDPERLDEVLGTLATEFEDLTSTSATRKGGQTYAGRTLVFEDCRRSVDAVFGSDLIERIGPALDLVLTSARWYTHEIARRYRAALGSLYDRLGAKPIGYSQFASEIPPLFPGPASDHGIVADVTAELQRRWRAIIGVEAASDRTLVELTSNAIRADVDGHFSAPGPGWPSARHHSPDVLIAAAGTEALTRGDYQLVLGELHVGLNTVTLPCLAKEHRDPQVLIRAREADLPEPGVAPTWSRARSRADFYSISRHDFDLEVGEGRSARPREQVLEVGELVVVREAGTLRVRSRDGNHEFDIIAFLEQHLIAETFSRFDLAGPGARTPRVAIDEVVVSRRRWSFDADELEFARESSELGRFAAVRRFAARHGLPLQLFVKTTVELKPFFVDLESPILVEGFVRHARRAARLGLSEMLPTAEQCWLPDADGSLYTSELRLVATDSTSWSEGRELEVEEADDR